MRNLLKVLTACLMFVPLPFAQSVPVKTHLSSDSATQEKGGTAKSETAEPTADVRFSVDMLDKNIDPCNDFYAYACSKWLVRNPIPADRSSWGRFNELQQRNARLPSSGR